jgi:hypothetical protein
MRACRRVFGYRAEPLDPTKPITHPGWKFRWDPYNIGGVAPPLPPAAGVPVAPPATVGPGTPRRAHAVQGRFAHVRPRAQPPLPRRRRAPFARSTTARTRSRARCVGPPCSRECMHACVNATTFLTRRSSAERFHAVRALARPVETARLTDAVHPPHRRALRRVGHEPLGQAAARVHGGYCPQLRRTPCVVTWTSRSAPRHGRTEAQRACLHDNP